MSALPSGGSVPADALEAPALPAPPAAVESAAEMEVEAGEEAAVAALPAMPPRSSEPVEDVHPSMEDSPDEDTDVAESSDEEVLISPLISGEQMVDLLAGSRPSSDYASVAARIRAGIALIFPEEAEALKRLYVPDDLLVWATRQAGVRCASGESDDEDVCD